MSNGDGDEQPAVEARLREIIRMQDQRIDQLTAENDALKRAAKVRTSAERKREAG